jgi:hypothetical protein
MLLPGRDKSTRSVWNDLERWCGFIVRLEKLSLSR